MGDDRTGAAMGSAFELDQWHDFFVLLGGATAALMGLVFVAMSLHLRAVLVNPGHRVRAGSSLLSLASLLLLAVVVLVPRPSTSVLGAEVTALALASPTYLAPAFVRRPQTHRVRYAFEMLSGVLSATLGVAAGISLVVRQGPGLGLLTPAVALGLGFAVWNAWRLMVDVAEGGDSADSGQ